MPGPIGRGEKESLAALTDIVQGFAAISSQPTYTEVFKSDKGGYRPVRGDIGISLNLLTGDRKSVV